MTIIPEKLCTACEQIKPLTDFHPHKGNRDGYRNQCKACRCAYFRDRYATNEEYRDHHLSRNRQHRNERYHNDPEYQQAEQSRVSANKKRFHEHIRRHQRSRYKNSSDFRAYRISLNNKRRAHEGSYTENEWRRLCEYFDHRCVCCGLEKPLTRDHVIPVTKGGTSYIWNMQPLCGICNSAKGTKTIDYRPVE